MNNIEELNNIELSIILYYADYISLRDTNTTVTDNCKYFFIYNAPINSAFLSNVVPYYDKTNQYFIQSYDECSMIENKFGYDGLLSFIANLNNLKPCGVVDAYNMLQCLHQFSMKVDRHRAFKKYSQWLSNIIYTHMEMNEKGDYEEVECTQYIAHHEAVEADKDIKRPKIYIGTTEGKRI